MAIKGAARARIKYEWKKCSKCEQMDIAKTVKNGVCIQCRADEYGIMPNMVMEHEDKLAQASR